MEACKHRASLEICSTFFFLRLLPVHVKRGLSFLSLSKARLFVRLYRESAARRVRRAATAAIM